MAGTNLTWTLISIAAFIAIISLGSLAYNEFSAANTLPSDPQYEAIYRNISEKRDVLDTTFKNPFSNPQNILKIGLQSIGTVITTAIIGLSAIFIFLQLPVILNDIFQNISEGSGLGDGGQILMWFFTFAIVIYTTMKVLKAIRGTPEEA